MVGGPSDESFGLFLMFFFFFTFFESFFISWALSDIIGYVFLLVFCCFPLVLAFFPGFWVG